MALQIIGVCLIAWGIGIAVITGVSVLEAHHDARMKVRT